MGGNGGAVGVAAFPVLVQGLVRVLIQHPAANVNWYPVGAEAALEAKERVGRVR